MDSRFAFVAPVLAMLMGTCSACTHPEPVVKHAKGVPAPIPIKKDSVGVDQSSMRAIPEKAWCVTAGKMEHAGGSLFVDQGGMRAVAHGDPSRIASLSFVYRGPSHKTAPLDSGELRRQIGLRLRTHDTCNAIYVMWRVEPKAGIFVSTKKNVGEATHAECGARGYHGFKALPSFVPPVVREGERHELKADLDGNHLKVWGDDKLAWEGDLPKDEIELDGPVGIRSDNGIFDFDVRANGDHEPGPCTGISFAKD